MRNEKPKGIEQFAQIHTAGKKAQNQTRKDVFFQGLYSTPPASCQVLLFDYEMLMVRPLIRSQIPQFITPEKWVPYTNYLF